MCRLPVKIRNLPEKAVKEKRAYGRGIEEANRHECKGTPGYFAVRSHLKKGKSFRRILRRNLLYSHL
jgi:hypothetical protein